jgi:hypothetical protein
MVDVLLAISCLRQVVPSSRRGSRNIEHIGSADGDAELRDLEGSCPRQRVAAGQPSSTLAWAAPQTPPHDLRDTFDRIHRRSGAHQFGPTQDVAEGLWDTLSRAYDVLAFERPTGDDEVFRQLVLARITSRPAALALPDADTPGSIPDLAVIFSQPHN